MLNYDDSANSLAEEQQKPSQRIRAFFRKKPDEFTFEPVTHPLEPHPVLPKSMMEAMAPA